MTKRCRHDWQKSALSTPHFSFHSCLGCCGLKVEDYKKVMYYRYIRTVLKKEAKR